MIKTEEKCGSKEENCKSFVESVQYYLAHFCAT
jgi:hypothetical protein